VLKVVIWEKVVSRVVLKEVILEKVVPQDSKVVLKVVI